MNARRAVALLVCLFAGGSALAQPRVDARNMYARILAVVPLTGKGSVDDPKRPMYAPAPSAVSSLSRTGILGYAYVTSDDGKFALVEYVARDRAAFGPILADPAIQVFLLGRDSREAAVAVFRKLKANYDFSKFGVRLP